MAPPIIVILGICFGAMALGALVLGSVYALAVLLKLLGKLIGGVFLGAGSLAMHLGRSLHGIVINTLRGAGSLVTGAALLPFSLLNVALGRWSAAGHFARESGNEFKLAGAAIYRAGVSYPLRLVGLGSLIEGLEQRLPAAVAAAPGKDLPADGPASFSGWTITGSLPRGGSGAKLFLAEPTADKRELAEAEGARLPEQVVIKAFSLDGGSTLPQIVRESRALDSARSMGLVLEHELTPTRFHYVMPYVPGDDLGHVARELHATAPAGGLSDPGMRAVLGYGSGLVEILARFHANGLWHKDIKPSNVIVSGDRVELVDLGLVTPLASAMTLTTHGTEYYRDPELVRLAMQGVKVHEVDGVKFDLYSVGALLYFLIEGDFPAHGNLSRLTKRCPDALRWVVRRAMAEINGRYRSADEMLSDLQVLIAARDPFALRPADLPSMGGAAAARAADQPPPLPLGRLRNVAAKRRKTPQAGAERSFAGKYHRAASRKNRWHASGGWEPGLVHSSAERPSRGAAKVLGFFIVAALGMAAMMAAVTTGGHESDASGHTVVQSMAWPAGPPAPPGRNGVSIGMPPMPVMQEMRGTRSSDSRNHVSVEVKHGHTTVTTHRARTSEATPAAKAHAPEPALRLVFVGQRPHYADEEFGSVVERLERHGGLRVVAEDGVEGLNSAEVEDVAAVRARVGYTAVGESDALHSLQRLVAEDETIDAVVWYGDNSCGNPQARLISPNFRRGGAEYDLTTCSGDLDQDELDKLVRSLESIAPRAVRP